MDVTISQDSSSLLEKPKLLVPRGNDEYIQ